jgi:hypothetical protein
VSGGRRTARRGRRTTTAAAEATATAQDKDSTIRSSGDGRIRQRTGGSCPTMGSPEVRDRWQATGEGPTRRGEPPSRQCAAERERAGRSTTKGRCSRVDGSAAGLQPGFAAASSGRTELAAKGTSESEVSQCTELYGKLASCTVSTSGRQPAVLLVAPTSDHRGPRAELAESRCDCPATTTSGRPTAVGLWLRRAIQDPPIAAGGDGGNNY